MLKKNYRHFDCIKSGELLYQNRTVISTPVFQHIEKQPFRFWHGIV